MADYYLKFFIPFDEICLLGALRVADFESEVIFQNSKWRRQNGGIKI